MTIAHQARLAVDIGGTFTDVVLEKGDQSHAMRAHAIKVLTTPDAPERGVIELSLIHI